MLIFVQVMAHATDMLLCVLFQLNIRLLRHISAL